jgi:hypothetical protein
MEYRISDKLSRNWKWDKKPWIVLFFDIVERIVVGYPLAANFTLISIITAFINAMTRE